MFEQAATTLAWKLLWRTVHQFIRHPYSNQWNQQPPSRWDFYLTSLFRTCYYKRSSRGPKAKCRKFFLVGSACELTSNGGSFRSKTSSLIHTSKMQDSSADWQTWLERIQHCFTHCIVQDISNVINSKTAVKIETILKHSPANTSHYKLGLAINKTATAITNIFDHNCFPFVLIHRLQGRESLVYCKHIPAQWERLACAARRPTQSITLRISRHRSLAVFHKYVTSMT